MLRSLCTAGSDGLDAGRVLLADDPYVALAALITEGYAIHDEDAERYFPSSAGRELDRAIP